jgi:hypothetical protein
MKKLWPSSKLFAFVFAGLVLLVAILLGADAEVQQTLAVAVTLGLPTLLGAEGFRNWQEAKAAGTKP